MFSYSKLEQVVQFLLSLKQIDDDLDIPNNICSALENDGVSHSDFADCLEYLAHNGFIDLYASENYPETDNIQEIVPLSPLKTYFADKARDEALRKKLDRRWRITTAIAFIGAITGIVSLIWLIWSNLNL